MAVLDDLKNLYDNGWDATFVYNGMDYGIFPETSVNIKVIIGPEKYSVSSLDELVNLNIKGRKLSDIMSKADVEYCLFWQKVPVFCAKLIV